MLDFLLKKPFSSAHGSPVLVLLHGRGSDMTDLQGLASAFPEQISIVTPQAPYPGENWGYGPGWAWYRYLGYGEAEAESLGASLRLLEEFLGALPHHLGFRPGPVVLGGFSQGGTMSLGFGLTRPGIVQGVVVLSGFLAEEESLGAGAEALENTPLFWAHGTQDPAVPFSLAVEGRTRLREAGVDFESRDYEMGHWVTPEEIADLNRWLVRSVPGWPDRD